MKVVLSTALLVAMTVTLGYSQATVSGSKRAEKQAQPTSTRNDPRPAPAPASVSATNQVRSSPTMGTPASGATSQPTRGARADYGPVKKQQPKKNDR